jgi:hypothetical protein
MIGEDAGLGVLTDMVTIAGQVGAQFEARLQINGVAANGPVNLHRM